MKDGFGVSDLSVESDDSESVDCEVEKMRLLVLIWCYNL